MTKSGRKRKKADKAKVQLKKGKKSLSLPKGLNVTDSRVTTKKITLVTQLTGPSQDDGPLTRKKIGMKVKLMKLSSFFVEPFHTSIFVKWCGVLTKMGCFFGQISSPNTAVLAKYDIFNGFWLHTIVHHNCKIAGKQLSWCFTFVSVDLCQ